MPITNIQAHILRLLASQRDPESYVARSTPLNRRTNRYSTDIDVFHDREELVRSAATADEAILLAAGYQVDWVRRLDTIQTANIVLGDERTKLEWVFDSDYRFFPTIPDEIFGYILHPIDLAMNKVMAAAARRALRDLIDLTAIDQIVLPLGPIIWAAVDKAPGFTPEGLIDQIRRNSNYPRVEWAQLNTETPLDPVEVSQQLRKILAEAEAFVLQMPTAKAGLLFLEDGKVVQPDPTRLNEYQTHAGQRRGHWPSSPDIANAMLERIASPGQTR